MWPRLELMNRRFGGTYRLHLQDRKIRERGISVRRWLQTEPPAEKPAEVCSHLLTLVPRSRIFLPWRCRGYVPPKRRFTQDLHGLTSQKTEFFSHRRENLKSYHSSVVVCGSLLSNGHCTVAYLAVDAYQRVYMQQYCPLT
jgi:hypothetical protein